MTVEFVHFVGFDDQPDKWPVAAFTSKKAAVEMLSKLQPMSPLEGYVGRLRLNPERVDQALEHLDEFEKICVFGMEGKS